MIKTNLTADDIGRVIREWDERRVGKERLDECVVAILALQITAMLERRGVLDNRPTPSAHDEIAAFEKSVREDACTQERLRMHRLLGYAIDCLIMEAEEIHVSCLPGLRVADSLVDP
jgi:hypothetical protein